MGKPQRWRVDLGPDAWSGLDTILKSHGDDAYDEALNELLSLEEDPTPADAEHMRRTKNYYRLYIYRSRYRAVYQVFFGKRLVWIERVGPRDTVYSGFERW